MKHFNALLAIVLLLPLVSLAQSNYKPGYVVTSKGDTVRGFIDYQDWGSNPTSISFKAAIANRDKRTFKISDMRLFNITGLAVYQKHVCSISMDARSASNTVSARDTTFRIDTVLLRVLQIGKNVALYTYTDGLKTRFYIGETPDFIPVELIYRIYESTNADGNNGVVTENSFQKQLFALAGKYNALDDQLTSLLQRSEYDSGDLLLIVSHINNISKSEFDKKYAHHSKITWYSGLALNISSTTANSYAPYTMGGGPGHTSYLPAIKFGIDFLPNADGAVEFKADISANFTQFSTLYQLDVSPYTGAKAYYNQTGIALTPQVLFNIYNAPDFKFYIGAGLSYTYNTYSDAVFEPQVSPGAVNFPVEGYYFTSSAFHFLAKAGFRIHKNLEVYFEYYTPDAATQSPYFDLYNENKQIGVNYYFGK